MTHWIMSHIHRVYIVTHTPSSVRKCRIQVVSATMLAIAQYSTSVDTVSYLFARQEISLEPKNIANQVMERRLSIA